MSLFNIKYNGNIVNVPDGAHLKIKHNGDWVSPPIAKAKVNGQWVTIWEMSREPVWYPEHMTSSNSLGVEHYVAHFEFQEPIESMTSSVSLGVTFEGTFTKQQEHIESMTSSVSLGIEFEGTTSVYIEPIESMTSSVSLGIDDYAAIFKYQGPTESMYSDVNIHPAFFGAIGTSSWDQQWDHIQSGGTAASLSVNCTPSGSIIITDGSGATLLDAQLNDKLTSIAPNNIEVRCLNNTGLMPDINEMNDWVSLTSNRLLQVNLPPDITDEKTWSFTLTVRDKHNHMVTNNAPLILHLSVVA